MTEKETRSLLNKYTTGTCSPEERAIVESWYLQETDASAEWELTESDYTRVDRRLKNKLGIRREPRVSKTWLAAASVILISGMFLFLSQRQGTSPEVKIAIQDTIVRPGGNYAILTLSNGKKITLDEKDSWKARTEDGVQVTRSTEGQIAISSLASKRETSSYSSIQTPVGGQFSIVLEDGTKVWLNSETTLRFPDAFAQGHRKVELTGEAYFEVSKDKHRPFTVSTDEKKIEVLGTHFNVRAYKSEETFRTTLLEGSVRITDNKSGKTTLMRPDDEVIIYRGQLTLNHIRTESAVAWKNGYFDFNNKTVETAMTELGRWYGVEVEYRNEAIRDLQLAGTISRYSDISQVLKKIELTGAAHFNRTGRTIIIE